MEPTYRVDLARVAGGVASYIDISDEFALERLALGEQEYRFAAPPRFDVTITDTGDAFVARGTVSADTLAVCSRCVCDFPLHLEGEVDGFYVRLDQTDELPQEQEYELIDAEDHIDLANALIGALSFQIPFVPLHDEQCAGLCPMCGADMNVEDCSCVPEPDTSNPFAALLELDLTEKDDG